MSDTADMFAPAAPAEPSPQEKWRAREPDDFDRVAHMMFDVPTSMRWLEVETLGDGKAPRHLTSFRILMADPPDAVFKSGPRKGAINWKKRNKSLDREVVLSFAQFDEFIAKNGSTFREALGPKAGAR